MEHQGHQLPEDSAACKVGAAQLALDQDAEALQHLALLLQLPLRRKGHVRHGVELLQPCMPGNMGCLNIPKFGPSLIDLLH